MPLTLNDLEMIQERLRDSTEFPATYVLGAAFASVWIASGLAKISAAYGAALVEQYVGSPGQLMSAMDY